MGSTAHVPAWVLDAFAAIMLLVAAVSAARLLTGRSWRSGAAHGADIDGAHVLMGVAMAGMLAASLATLPGRVWAAVFTAVTAWFGGRVGRDSRGMNVRAALGGRYVPHLAHSAAMLYMVTAVTMPPAMNGSPGTGMAATGAALRVPALALLFALVLSGYALRDLARLTRRTSRARSGPDGQLAGATAPDPAGGHLGGRLAMGVSMTFMLILLL